MEVSGIGFLHLGIEDFILACFERTDKTMDVDGGMGSPILFIDISCIYCNLTNKANIPNILLSTVYIGVQNIDGKFCSSLISATATAGNDISNRNSYKIRSKI